ncbi:MAG: translation initiation factor IF-2 [Fidelibacterota bacterium]|nr:MAG: translation initiation factor IF-2 [Candidatus Neomarinimicrobiota bacterium]
MTEPAVKKPRIFQIAKELNISHTEIMEFLERDGIKVASHMSQIEPDVYERILGEFAKEKVIVDRHRKEMARRDAALTRRKSTSAKGRFERILSIDEQRQIEADEAKRAKLAREETEKQRRDEEAQRKKDEELNKQLALEELKRQKEAAKAAEEELREAAAAATAPPIDDEKKKRKAGKKAPATVKPKLKRIDIREIEGKIAQGRKKPATTKDKREVADARVKSIEQTLRQTLASMSTRERRRKIQRREKVDEIATEASIEQRPSIKIHKFMSISELAAAMDVSSMDVISSCMQLGIMATINQRLDLETLSVLAEEFGFSIEEEDVLDDETVLQDMAADTDDTEELVSRPPIVTVMGHVDHGKTSLLDYIRSTNVVGGESGGITQHIGAYEVTLPKGQRITFLDTPGHEAFTAMRSRGAQITDIVVLVVAADDAVMPQTVEAINHAKAAGVHIVVAINKIDKPNADSERVKRELSENEVLVEDWGGKVQSAEISAKRGDGVQDLLDKILVEAEILDLQAVKEAPAVGTIIESRLDKGLGPVATVLVQKGTLIPGDTFLCGSQIGRVRAMQNERGIKAKAAYPSDPVQIQGFENVPQAGDRFIIFEDEREAKRIGSERSRVRREIEYRRKSVRTLDEISRQIREGEVKQLSILIKADVDGSLEALSDALDELSAEEVAVDVIHRGVGMVSENDVLLALASNAVIIAFRVSTSSGAKILAKKDGVEIRNYDVIYNAVDEVKLALEGLLEPEKVESPLGIAEVRATFRIPGIGTIAGCYMKDGKAIRNTMLRVKRDGELLHEGKLTSLKRFKDDVKEVQEGYECGIGIEGFSDFTEGDILEVFEVKEVKRTLA